MTPTQYLQQFTVLVIGVWCEPHGIGGVAFLQTHNRKNVVLVSTVRRLNLTSSDFQDRQTDRPISLRIDDRIPAPIEEASAIGGGHRNLDDALLRHASLVT